MVVGPEVVVVDVVVLVVVVVEVVVGWDVVVPGGLVVGGGEAWAWAGASIELITGLVHVLGSTRPVTTPPTRIWRTCLRV